MVVTQSSSWGPQDLNADARRFLNRWRGHFALALLGVLAPAFVFHLHPLFHFDWHWSRPDQLWLLTTLLTSAVTFAIAVLPVPKWQFGWRTIVVLLHVALQYSNLENFMALGGIADISLASHFMDPAFLRGSGFNISHPWSLGLATVIAVIGLILSRSSGLSRKPWSKLLVISTLLFFVGLAALAERSEFGLWRQRDPIFHAMSRTSLALRLMSMTRPFMRTAGVAVAAEDATRLDGWRQAEVAALDAADQLRVDKMFQADEPKAFRVSPKPKSNVLLIVVEGLSNGYFKDDREVPYFDPARHLQKLETWLKGRAHIRYQNFFAQNRQTHRGQFSLLCGEYHNMASQRSKFEDVSEGLHDASRCLPNQLSQSGYQTSYLQAGDLQFHKTDSFMSVVGFESIRGLESFAGKQAASGWGVDDGTLFRDGLTEVNRLREQGKPWLLMLQTIGTHHPYPVPELFRHQTGLTGDRAAYAFLDQELTAFLQSLADRGDLNDTLVLITSDESSGLSDEGEQISFISQSWIPLIVLGAGVEGGNVESSFVQADISKSIAWFTRANPSQPPAMGRNIFGHYDSPRDFAFGNRYLLRVGMQTKEGRTIACSYDLAECVEYETRDRFPFVDRKVGEASAKQKSVLHAFLLRNEEPDRATEIITADSSFRERTFHILNRDRATAYLNDVRIKVEAGIKRCVTFPIKVVKGEVELFAVVGGNGMHEPRGELQRLKAGEIYSVGFCLDGGTDGAMVEVGLMMRNLGEGVAVVRVG